MKKTLFILTLIFTSGLFAQQSKVNFQLRNTIQQSKGNEQIALFVRGEVDLIKQAVLELGGKVKLSAGNIVQVELPSSTIYSFSANQFVQSIEYSFSKPTILSDTMLIHNNVIPIHQGASPLFQPYTGKGVVMGFIDTGIDFAHLDFKDTLGNTRILAIWDQYLADNGSSAFGYGQVWDSVAINGGTCTHLDHGGTNHGTHVAGIAAGNGLAVNNYKGVAPESYIVSVSSNQNISNWLSTVVDAVKFIYDVADSYNMPCVINVSMGDYWGSHDGTDAASLLIDSIVNYKPGRAFVCAAGNAGHINWHVEHQITSDTTFTWFKYNPSSAFGYGAVYFEAWADTADLNNVDFSIGANLPSGSFELRGNTPFVNIQNRLGSFTDTIYNNGNRIAIVDTYGELQGDKYNLAVHLQEPDSNTYNFSFMTTGSGKLDIWSASWLGVSNMVNSGLPSVAVLPQIAFYERPDSAKTMVSSFQNLSSILTVANFNNRASYLDIDSIVRYTGQVPGEKAISSSWGPTRRGLLKPDVAATGDNTIGPVSQAIVDLSVANPPNQQKIAFGGKHRINGGTSMASPVIAGVAALYLEKCPTATMVEIKNAIQNTAKQDVYTGTVPNIGFGYGKVNAFDVLNHSNYSVSLGADVNICDGDSVDLNPGSYSSYVWFNNDTNSTITIDSTEVVYVVVTNNSGCKSFSDTLQTTWHALPQKPTLTVLGNDTLLYSSTLDLQWYYNTSVLSGESDTILIAQNNGDYFLTVTDSFSCVNYSDTITLLTVGNHDFENEIEISIYPNPTTSTLNIISSNNEPIFKLNLLDVTGKNIQTIKPHDSVVKLNLKGLSEGVYFLQLVLEKSTFTKKIMLKN
ncbi:MAG: S8 family peptidase [Flavobacteriales bacterium]|nr:S8 family peptidase [Flavobacteriales bacterium]